MLASPYDTEDMALAELWVLADKMAVPALQNLVVSKIIAIREKTDAVAVKTLYYIYQRTGIDSPLRKLMVSEVAHNTPQREFSDDAEHFPHEFLINLAHYMMALRSKDDEYKTNASDFFVSLSSEGKATGGS
jgi:hypothetical protein